MNGSSPPTSLLIIKRSIIGGGKIRNNESRAISLVLEGGDGLSSSAGISTRIRLARVVTPAGATKRV